MAGKILRSGTEGYATLEDLETNLGPLPDGLKSNTTVDKSLSKITTMSAQSVCANDDGTGRLVSLKESKSLTGGEEVEELLSEILRVAIVRANILDKL
jgi:hypothetical protein